MKDGDNIHYINLLVVYNISTPKEKKAADFFQEYNPLLTGDQPDPQVHPHSHLSLNHKTRRNYPQWYVHYPERYHHFRFLFDLWLYHH